mmetsp:Transcript_25219/g.25432  ORF Transcript_25219/g.25432 Transcript_25219/m.25432 type:complete len:133 (-) Transcript_25219:148-546(-)
MEYQRKADTASLKIQSAYRRYYIRKILGDAKKEFSDLCVEIIAEQVRNEEIRYSTLSTFHDNSLTVTIKDFIDDINIFEKLVETVPVQLKSTNDTLDEQDCLSSKPTVELQIEIEWLEKSIRDRIKLISLQQ